MVDELQRQSQDYIRHLQEALRSGEVTTAHSAIDFRLSSDLSEKAERAHILIKIHSPEASCCARKMCDHFWHLEHAQKTILSRATLFPDFHQKCSVDLRDTRIKIEKSSKQLWESLYPKVSTD